ncbi:uncharacterized protein LOC135114827 isoform X2 [Scylla paramamosain]|uniref:uncharacterized protein LOC135114827 isoform X2 n=1 Tax=Scylla paramamosain TaxID=85552 RepID=UPI003082F0B0
MASLLPSEVARLVLGYLEENGCQKSSEKLLEELAELSEFVKLKRKGRRVATRIGNQSLEDMLMDYSAAKDLMMESVRNNSATLRSVPKSGGLLCQVKALISIILKNKFIIKKQKGSIGTARRVKQRCRTLMLQRDSQLQQSTVSADSLESLPCSQDQDTDHTEHLSDRCPEKGPCSSHGHSSGQLSNSAQADHIAHDVEDVRQDSLGGDSTSASLTHDLDISHQRRKGTVKRRSHGCEVTPTKMSPVLDTEANFEKILKNLYENTALHEKIAESINRGLSTQCKAGSSHSEGSSHSSGSPCSKKVRDTGSGGSSSSSSNTEEGREKHHGSVDEVAGNNSGDVALLKEFDHIVTGIVSEATSDPVFENLIDEVFGCISPQSSSSKGDGSNNSNQGNLHDNSIGPPRLLSTPVPPPPSSAVSSHSVLHIPQTLPLHPSSVSPVMTQQSPLHNLSTPHHHTSPLSVPPHLASSGTPLSSFTSLPLSAPSPCKSFPESTPKKTEDVWINKSLPYENSPSAKSVKSPSTDSLRDAMQESLQNNASVNNTKESTVDSWSSSLRMETGDASVTKHNIGEASVSCGTESPSQKEGCERTRATPPSPTARTRSRRKKKLKCSSSAKSGKEEDKNLGEQLLKEFADFQSSRPDKICVEKKSDADKNTDRCEAPDETEVQSLDLPAEEGKTTGNISSSDPLQRLSEESTLTIDAGQETHSPGPSNTSENEAVVMSEVNENVIAVDKDQIDKGTVEMERIECNSKPGSTPLSSEALSAAPYTSDSNVDKTEEKTKYENESSMMALDSVSRLPIRSSTIPGIGNPTSSPEDNTYTLTELTPVNPIDLTSIVSSLSLCEADDPHVEYSHRELATTSGDPQPSISSEVHSSNVWDHSTQVTPIGHVQEGTSDGDEGEEASQGFTIILPPVSSRKEADEQFLSIFGGCEAQVNSGLVTIAPKTVSASSLPPDSVKQIPAKNIATYTLPNSVTISIPDITSDTEVTEKVPKKRKRKTTLKKKGSATKKLKETHKSAKTTVRKKRYGRIIDVSVRKVSARGKRRISNQKQEKVEKDVTNDIIGTALSFALKSVTPEKKFSAETSSRKTPPDAAVDLEAEVENAAVEGAADMLGVATVCPGTSASITETCGGVVEKQTVEMQSTNKQASIKYNSGRSPQLKALLHLSKSISPAKRALAWKNVTQSEESPVIRVLHMRGSQSTPSRKNSHIRVLDFSTPQKRLTSAGSPRRGVANLKFSPPEGKKSPRKLTKALRSLSRKFGERSSVPSKPLSRIVEESEMGSEAAEAQPAPGEQGKAKSRKLLAKDSRDSSTLKHEKSDLKSKVKPRWSRQSSMSESEFSVDTSKAPIMMTEDEDSIVLYLDGEDSMSSSGRTPPTDSGSIELFDLSKEQESYQDFNFNTALKNLNPDSISEDELPCLMDPLPSSSTSSHSGGKQMETPHKAAQASSSLATMTPVCLEPPTPLLQTEQKSTSLPCDDLNTPIPQVIPNLNKTPLIKHYPQGPYSNSSVGTSYYMPSERSLTESEDYSPSKLDTVLEKTLSEELHSPSALDQSDADVGAAELNKTSYYNGSASDKSPVKRSPLHNAKKSPTKLSRKVMGQMIEREMSRLFSSQDSSGSLKETSQDSAAEVSNDSTSKDSSKGKQGKKRRVPSKKYLNIAESTCSEDEGECNSDSMSASRKHKKTTRKSGASNHNTTADKFDKADNMRKTQKGKVTLSSPDISKAKKNSVLSTGRLDSEEHSMKPVKAGDKHSHGSQNQLSQKQDPSDSENSSCHSPERKITSDKEMEQENSVVNPKSLLELFGFCSSSDSSNESLKERTTPTVELIPACIGGKEDDTMSTGMLNSENEFTFESPTKKRKRSTSSENVSSKSSVLEDDKQNMATLRRSQRSTRARGVAKYQAEPGSSRGVKRGRGNARQRIPRGRGRRSGDLHVEEVIIEAVVETPPSQHSREPHDGEAAQEEIAAKRNAGRGSFGAQRGRGRGRGRGRVSVSVRGRSSMSPGSVQHPGKELQENEKHSRTTKTSKNSMKVEKQASIQQENEEQDRKGLKGQQSSKEPFSRWGSGMRIPELKRPGSSPPVSADALKAHWASKLKELCNDKDVSSTPTGEEGAKKPCVSAVETRPAQENCITLLGSDSEDDLPCLMASKPSQRESNITPAREENTMHSGDKASRKQPRAPSSKASQCQNTTSVQEKGTQKKQQQQIKGGVHKHSLSQGCARTVVYDWKQSNFSLHQFIEMGNVGQVINVTSLFSKKRKIGRNSPAATSEPSAKRTSFARIPDVAGGQTSTSRSSAQQNSATKSAPQLLSQHRSNTPKITQKFSGEGKSNTQKSTQKLSAEMEHNTQENTQNSSGKENSSNPENTVKLAEKEKNSIVKNTPNHSTGDELVPRNTPDSSSATASQLLEGEKGSTSKSRIQSLDGEGSSCTKCSPSSSSTAFDTLLPKNTADTVSSGSKKVSSSNSMLHSQAAPKENSGSRPAQKASDSADMVPTQPSHHTDRMAATHTSSTLSTPLPHAPQKESGIEQNCSDAIQKVSKNRKLSSKPPNGEDSCKKVDASNSHMNEKEYCSASPKSAESYSDLEETSEEHCLMSYTMLPPTPEKKMGRICHTMVKEGKAMVAFPSPSKPYPSPEQALPQSTKPKTQLRDQLGSPDSSARRCLDLSSVCHPPGLVSTQNKLNQSLQGKPKAEVNSQLSSGKADALQENNGDLLREKTVTTDEIHLKVGKETSLDKDGTVSQGNMQGEERSHLSGTPQSIRKEDSRCETHTNLEQPSTRSNMTSNTSESSRKQTPTDFKHFSTISQQHPETDKNQGSEPLREDDCEEKMEEEEDSDVLKIEEPSENENEEIEEVICTLSLTLTDFIDIFSMNVPERQKPKTKRPTMLATKQNKQARKNLSPRKKTESPSQKSSPQHRTAPHTPRKNKSPQRKRTSGSSAGTHTPLEDQHHMKEAKRVSTVRDDSNSYPTMQSLSTPSPRLPRDTDTHSGSQERRQEYGCYAGRSKPADRIEESNTSTKKRRRITPIRIGDVERHIKGPKGSWGDAVTSKKSHWAQNRVNTGGGHQEMTERRESSLTQPERPGGCQGNLSERSASSLSSLSPGCLLISESPRGADSSPAPCPDLIAPSAPTLATPTKSESLSASSSSSASKLFLNSRAGKQQTSGDAYYIESETSREPEEDHCLGKQRRVRHMAKELHRGGNLEIARSPDKQLAVMMSHPQEGMSVYMSEESFHSLSSTPPTPGKHLFIPPPPILASSFSSTSNSSSSSSSFSHPQAKQEPANLPLKKRKDVTISGQRIGKRPKEM